MSITQEFRMNRTILKGLLPLLLITNISASALSEPTTYSKDVYKESILDGSGNKEILIEDLESGFTKLKKLRESTKEKIPDYLKGMYI